MSVNCKLQLGVDTDGRVIYLYLAEALCLYVVGADLLLHLGIIKRKGVFVGIV